MNYNNDDKVFFSPGDLVMIKHDIINRPVMFVSEKMSRSTMNKEGDTNTIFLGMRCKWFDSNMVLQEAIFSTKDLIHV